MASDLRDLSTSLRTVGEDWVRSAAAEVRTVVLAAARSDLGGDLKMSGAGINLNAKVRVFGGGAVTTGVVSAQPLGPWRWITEGTPVGGGNRRQGGNSPARGTWPKGVDRAIPQVLSDMDRRWAKVV
jgi:hypothetical protein